MNNGLEDAAEVDGEITPAKRALFSILLAANIVMIVVQLYCLVKRYRASRRKAALVKEIAGQRMGVMLRLCPDMPRYFGSICYETDPNYAPFPLNNPPHLDVVFYQLDPDSDL